MLRLPVLLLLPVRIRRVDLLLVRGGRLGGGKRRRNHRRGLTVVLRRRSVLGGESRRRGRSRLLRRRAVRRLMSGVAGLRRRRGGSDGEVRHLLVKLVRGRVLLNRRRRRGGMTSRVRLSLRRVTRLLRNRQGGRECRRRDLTRGVTWRLRRIRLAVLTDGRRRSRDMRLQLRPDPLTRLSVPNRLGLLLPRMRLLLRLRLWLLTVRILRRGHGTSRLRLLQSGHRPVVLLHLPLVLCPLLLVLAPLFLLFCAELLACAGRRALRSGRVRGSGVRVGRLCCGRLLHGRGVRLLRRTGLRVAVRLDVLRRVLFCA